MKFLRPLVGVVFASAILLSQAQTLTMTANPRASQSPLVLGVQKYLPEFAKKQGLTDVNLQIEYHRSSADALNFVIKGDKILTVASIPAVINFNKKSPGVVKFLAMANVGDYYLICKPYVKDIADIKKNNYIVSIVGKYTSPHLILKKLAKDNFGDADALEGNIATMTLGQTQQLMAQSGKGIDCAMPGIPVQNLMLDASNKLMYNQGSDTWAGIQNAYVINTEWAKQNPKHVKALLDTIKFVSQEFTKNPEPFIKLFVENDQLDITTKDLAKHYKTSNMRAFTKFTKEIVDMAKYAESVGFIVPGGADSINAEMILDASKL